MPRWTFAVLAVFAAVLFAIRSPADGEELLSNSGFESGVSPWSTTHGQLDAVSSPVHGGSQAARLTSSALQSHEVYRLVQVAPGQTYQFSGWVLLNDPAVERVFLRVSWFDALGGPVSQSDSPWLTIPSADYQFTSTGALVSPLAAASARVGVRVQASSQFGVHIDDLSFNGAIPPPPTAQPTPPPSTAPTPVASKTPAPATKTPKPATPTKTPESSPGPNEPEVFDSLTNAGFETARSDGTPYGWRDVGADLSVTEAARAEGQRSLAVVSRSSSTKWAYQTVRVQPGTFYQGTVHTWNLDANESFLRISWYASDDGSGPALDSSDSTAVAGRGNGFQPLTTGPIQAPQEAHTAKVRLMVRPDSEAAATVYFDAVSFAVTAARPGTDSANDAGNATSRARASDAGGSSADDATTAQPLVERHRLGITNGKPAATAPPAAVAGPSGNYDWLAVLGIAIGAVAISYAVATELSRRRKARKTDD